MVVIETENEEQTKAVGRVLSEILSRQGGGVVGLKGELGAGKTVFVKGMAEGLGISEKDVRSPTFVLAVRHQGISVLWHLDAYRLDEKDFEVSCGEAFEEGGIVAVEWGDKVEKALPPDTVWVQIEHLSPSKRRIIVRGSATIEKQMRHRLER